MNLVDFCLGAFSVVLGMFCASWYHARKIRKRIFDLQSQGKWDEAKKIR